MLFLSFANSDEFVSYCESRGIVPGAGNGASIISDADVTALFSNSLLIGSSTTVGFNLYFNSLRKRHHGRYHCLLESLLFAP